MLSFKPVLKITLSFMALVQLAACSVELRDKDQKDEAPVASVDARADRVFPLFSMQGPGYRILSAGRPNDYRLEIQPPEGSVTTIKIVKEGLARSKSWSLANSFEDGEAKPGDSFEYRFLGAEGRELGRVNVDVPIDLVVNTSLDFSKAEAGAGTDSLRRYRRVFLGAEAVLMTRDQDIEIQAEELYAEAGARLITFEKNSLPPVGLPALSGGLLKLVIDQAVGSLKVEMRGQDGRDGNPGAAFTERATPGQSFANQGHKHCDHIAAGTPGQPGQRGNQGQKGGDGGHSGSLEVVTLSTLQIDVVFEGGKAGKGGEGGPGQLGGLGGQSEVRVIRSFEPKTPDNPVARHDTYTCSSPANGANGTDGDKGPPGVDGTDGREGLYCRRVSGGTCEP